MKNVNQKINNLFSFIKKHHTFMGMLVVVIIWTIIFILFNPKDIVERIGLRNGYIIAFSIAFLGGVSSITGTTLYATMYTLIAGNSNPLLLGTLVGFGICFGDSFYYYLGTKGRKIVQGFWGRKLNKLSIWIGNRSCKRTVPAIVYLYSGFAPLPNDILMVALALGGCSYKRIIPWLILGNLTHMISVSLLMDYGILIFSRS